MVDMIPLLSTLVSVFNLNYNLSKDYFEKVVEPSYTSIIGLHNDYIDKLNRYKKYIRETKLTPDSLISLSEEIKCDIILSEHQRLSIKNNYTSIKTKKKNRIYTNYLESILQYINTTTTNLYITPIGPIIHERYNNKITDKNDNKKKTNIVYYQPSYNSNIIRTDFTNMIFIYIKIINKLGLNKTFVLKKRFILKIDKHINILNSKIKSINYHYWELKNQIYR